MMMIMVVSTAAVCAALVHTLIRKGEKITAVLILVLRGVTIYDGNNTTD